MFSKQLVEKVRELDSQKQQTEKAFHGFLPPSLVRDMKRDQVTRWEEPDQRSLIVLSQQTLEEFECVTIFFGEILGFEDIVRDCTPTEVHHKIINAQKHREPFLSLSNS